MDEFDLSNVFVGVLQRSSARSEEYIPDLVREIFKFLDLDDNGTISSAEIKLPRLCWMLFSTWVSELSRISLQVKPSLQRARMRIMPLP